MLSEEKIRQRYLGTIKNYAKSGETRFLERMEILGEILEITPREEQALVDEAIEKYSDR